jgi:ABC-type nitrate/sulfonate/bicarbonate transport system permease component
MKAQLLKRLTVGLITSAMLSPAVILWWKIWQYHSEFVNVQPVVPSTDGTMLDLGEFWLTDGIQQLVKAILLVITTPDFLGFLVSVSLGFWMGLWLNNRNQTRRHMTLKQQVATLEKLWQQSIY